MPNPLDEYTQTKEAEKENRKKNEIDLWHTWKTQGKKPEQLTPLMRLYEPTLNYKLRQWKAPNVPASAFKLVLQKHFIGALETYDPSRGTALNTHVENRLQKAKRYNAQTQNMAYIPEGQISKISPINKAHEELKEDLGRDPTNAEIADHLGLTEKRVETIRRSQRKDIAGSKYETDPSPKPSNYEESQLAIAANILPTLFPGKPQLHDLFHHIFGTNDYEKITSTTALAKKFGTNLSQISRMKKQLGQTLGQKMGITLPELHREDE